MADAETVGRVSPGDHACLTFSNAEERLDLVAAFVRDGLRRGQKVLCWTDELSPEGLAGELARRAARPGAALRRGQVTGPAAAQVLHGTGAAMGARLARR